MLMTFLLPSPPSSQHTLLIHSATPADAPRCIQPRLKHIHRITSLPDPALIAGWVASQLASQLLLSPCTTIARRAGTTHAMPHPYHAAVLRVRPIMTERWGDVVARVGAGRRAEWLGWAFLLFLAVFGGGSVGWRRRCYCAVLCWVCGMDFRVGLGQLGEVGRLIGGPGEGVWWWWIEGLRVMVSRLLCVVCVYGLFTSMICACVLHVSQLTAVHEFDSVPGE
jgi:hypothetical protein